MPEHNHTASTNTTGEHTHTYKTYYGTTGLGPDGSTDREKTINTGSSGYHSHTVTINNAGSSQAHNNIQPYISVYMWKRIA